MAADRPPWGPRRSCRIKWAFGDGLTGTGQTLAHAYAVAGSYSVRLTVTDSLARMADPVIADPESLVAAPSIADDHRATDAPSQDTEGPDQAPTLIAVLEQWLDAIHGSRAQPRS